MPFKLQILRQKKRHPHENRDGGHAYDHSFPLRSKAPKEYETRYL